MAVSVPAMHTGSRLRGYASIAVAAIIWGSTGIFTSQLYMVGFEPLQLAVFRTGLAFLALLPAAIVRSGECRVAARFLPWLIPYSFLTVLLFAVTFLYALQLLPVAVAVTLMSCAAFFATILGRLLYGEFITASKTAAMMVALLGVAFITGLIQLNAQKVSFSWIGIAAGLGSAVAFAMYSVMGKRILREMSPVICLVYNLGLGLAMLITVDVLIAGSLVRLPRINLPVLVNLVGLGLFAHLGGWFAFVWGLRFVDASRASITLTLEPMAATLLAYVFLRQSLGPLQMVGLVLVVAGLLLNQYEDMRGAPGSTEPSAGGSGE